jgi:2-oxoglutarate dehydrogenase E2 component (dihydrolipoamide succinyltransferase)
MATFNIVMPKLGESVQEATIIKWFKKVGDKIEEEESLLEIATDKVDSEIPSPVDGVISKILFEENALVPVGETIAIVDTDGEAVAASENKAEEKKPAADRAKEQPSQAAETKAPEAKEEDIKDDEDILSESKRFYSPLVRNIAKSEGISSGELEKIKGTGHEGRVRKQDILDYIGNRAHKPDGKAAEKQAGTQAAPKPKISVTAGEGDEIIAMDRLRKMIAENMVLSKQISPHVTNFIEADVTGIVLWRNKVKEKFEKREKTKLTYMPVFIEAVTRTLKDFPWVNASVDGDKIILRKHVNIGIAVALPTGNLIVPVIKDADQKSLLGLTVELNNLADKARNNKLSPDDIQGGTFTISNFGTFGNITGTPIINQPQVAILATGNIEKKPAVLETPTGDVIAIRHKMILALTYDHRIVDGALAGRFLKSITEYLESFDTEKTI